MAKQYRMAAGKSRAETARELHVSQPAVLYAEEYPEKSFQKLRRRIIEAYSDYVVEGPVYLLKQKATSRRIA